MKNPGFIGMEDIQNVYAPTGFSYFRIEGRGLGSAAKKCRLYYKYNDDERKLWYIFDMWYRKQGDARKGKAMFTVSLINDSGSKQFHVPVKYEQGLIVMSPRRDKESQMNRIIIGDFVIGKRL